MLRRDDEPAAPGRAQAHLLDTALVEVAKLLSVDVSHHRFFAWDFVVTVAAALDLADGFFLRLGFDLATGVVGSSRLLAFASRLNVATMTIRAPRPSTPRIPRRRPSQLARRWQMPSMRQMSPGQRRYFQAVRESHHERRTQRPPVRR